MYWRIRSDSKNYRFLVDDGNIYSSQEFLGLQKNIIIDQDKLKFRLDDERECPIGSFLPANTGILASTRPIFSLFHEELEKSIHRLYFGQYDLGELVILAILEERNGFDFQRSAYKSFDDGDIYEIRVLRLVAGFHTDLDIFRLGDNFGTRFELIVSDNFKSKYEKNNLTGLIFESTE